MITETQLKQKLQSLAQNEFQLAAVDDLDALLEAMMAHIGSPDPELRDELIYTTFMNLIYRQQALSAGQLRHLLHHALDEQHLFYGISEQGTDSVFTRAFSALSLPLVLIAHRTQPFLSPAEVHQVQESLLRFFREEQDRRGYVGEKGWAHAIAHGADALDDLAQCAEVDADGLREILNAVRSAVCVLEYVYAHGEDERLVTPVIAVLRRNLIPGETVAGWVGAFADAVLAVDQTPLRLQIQANVKNFLQSLYFRLTWAELAEDLRPVIARTLREFNRLAGN
jgi:hypothetical protein